MRRSADFSLLTLYAALDAQRQARGITWQQVMREISARSPHSPVREISRTTVASLRTKAIAEADGVLQMLRWLNRTPESFVPGCEAAGPGFELPDVLPHQILRFDTRRLHAALDAQRIGRCLTWQQVANDIEGASAASLTRLKKGGRTDFPSVMRMVGWLGRPAADFTRGSDR